MRLDFSGSLRKLLVGSLQSGEEKGIPRSDSAVYHSKFGG